MIRLTSLLLALTAPTSLFAGEYVLGLGYDDVLDQTGTEAAAFVVEYHFDPFYSGERASYGWGFAGQVDTDSDVFVGFGVHANWAIGSGNWFVEGSFMPGYYDEGSSGTDLGGNVQFRSLIGIGYALTAERKLSLAIDHKSNADIEDRNPGSETLVLRYTVDF